MNEENESGGLESLLGKTQSLLRDAEMMRDSYRLINRKPGTMPASEHPTIKFAQEFQELCSSINDELIAITRLVSDQLGVAARDDATAKSADDLETCLGTLSDCLTRLRQARQLLTTEK